MEDHKKCEYQIVADVDLPLLMAAKIVTDRDDSNKSGKLTQATEQGGTHSLASEIKYIIYLVVVTRI